MHVNSIIKPEPDDPHDHSAPLEDGDLDGRMETAELREALEKVQWCQIVPVVTLRDFPGPRFRLTYADLKG